MVLVAVPQAHVIGYNVRTPGFSATLVLNNVTGVMQKTVKMRHQRDENDSPPVLNCHPYGDSCADLVMGFPSAETATLPAPLLRLTATDDDTGSYGIAGIKYSLNSTAFSVDPSGLLYLVDKQDERQVVEIVAEDNLGNAPSNSAKAELMAVPVADNQLFFVRTSRQLTDAAAVTSLLEEIRKAGSYKIVQSLEFQALNYVAQTTDGRHGSSGTGGRLYIYAIRRDGRGLHQAVGLDDFRQAITKMASPKSVQFVETREDQKHRGDDRQSVVTGLAVGLAVVGGLLLILIVVVVVRERTHRRNGADISVRDVSHSAAM
ncbi:uncharacterized protein LOC119104918 isoform X2 [Pollicipes pollicipes]|uniref:uncharacterized protein LOC119104918 isoform X2 n=1 Tax=Pollicipes pollicipes TaxID=41117 RepID=UPI00188572B2|nr:uncharacterized protein LOC119104918 isoform X2 [Pollicipes pollicipes]